MHQFRGNHATKTGPARVNTILGIDPGSRITGFGVVRIEGQNILHVSHGVIAPPVRLEFNARIAIIAEEMDGLIARLCPEVTVIEQIFLGKNADSAFKLGHARGVIVASAMRAGSQVVEYATRSVKKGITGKGSATKEQVQFILFTVLGLIKKEGSIDIQMQHASDTPIDASDALALAYYHARQMTIRESFNRQAANLSGRRKEEEL